jgi:putative ABC transport system ATP-binding protein
MVTLNQQKHLPAIEAEDVQFSFGEGELKKQILFDVSFYVKQGEIVLLTGPSGSGKTTLLTLIGGLRQLKEGQLKVLGLELFQAQMTNQLQVRRGIGFIFQQHNLLPFLTALQNVELMLSLHPELQNSKGKATCQKLLEKVGLGERLHYIPHKLSGGQRQRVAIARALACHPQLILADEPTAALDSQSGRDVADLLRDLARDQGCTILMVTHDNRVLDIADRIFTMEDGRLSMSANHH